MTGGKRTAARKGKRAPAARGGAAGKPGTRSDRPRSARAFDPASIPTERLREFGRRLRAWYRVSSRDLPWRRTRDPYHVLVSELMLQQTQVARVVPKYHEFLGVFPTLADVASAPAARVAEAWSGLGYYARARNLHRLARHVTGDGGPGALPSDPTALRALPGIGAYTAGAVASFAYERRAALVDTNVARVLRRVFAPDLVPKSTAEAKAAWALAEATLPRAGKSAWTHNQALMELGALVCTARLRHCGGCPVKRVCETHRRHECPEPGRARAGTPRR
ncbi:MAG: A/G-specific adenine glycosylase [Gemmatimonadaceae bacterium]